MPTGFKNFKTLSTNIQIVEDKGFIELVEFSTHLKTAVELPHRTCVAEHIREEAAEVESD